MLMMDRFTISTFEMDLIQVVNNLCLLYFVIEVLIKLIGFIITYLFMKLM